MPQADSTPKVFVVKAGGPVLPLQGVTLLLVEDSRYASDALRLMAQRSGARMRRTATLADARRHLQLYRPDIVLVDMGMPDGSGADLISDLAQAPDLVVVGLSGDPDQRLAALQAGAAGFLEKPIVSLADFQAQILAFRGDPGGWPVAEPGPEVVPDTLALREDLREAAQLLAAGPDHAQRQYLAGFLSGVARSADDPALAQAAKALPSADTRAVDRLAGLLSLRIGAQPQAFS